MELIQARQHNEYPTEYLLARIRGRRRHFVKDWDSLVHSPDPFESLLSSRYAQFISTHSIDGVWTSLLQEFNWIYLQMNSGLRNIFKPFFIYAETKTLITCFRYRMSEGTGTGIKALLSPSLLSHRVKKILTSDKQLSIILHSLEKLFYSLYETNINLVTAFSKCGLIDLEKNLTTAFLDLTSHSKLHSILKIFFAHIVDAKNLTSLHKHLRWGIDHEPLLLHGGTLSTKRLKRIFQSGDLSSLDSFTNIFYAVHTRENGSLNIENILNRDITRRLKFLARESQDIGLLLHYLWSSYMEALNLSILLRGREMDRNRLREELVY